MTEKPYEIFPSLKEQVARSKAMRERWARAEREQRAETYADTHAIVSRAFGATMDLRDAFGAPVTETAAKIILMGKIRRGEIPDPRSVPPPGSKARAILNAGRRRRNEPEL
jgi:hypothetical protein